MGVKRKCLISVWKENECIAKSFSRSDIDWFGESKLLGSMGCVCKDMFVQIIMRVYLYRFKTELANVTKPVESFKVTLTCKIKEEIVQRWNKTGSGK